MSLGRPPNYDAASGADEEMPQERTDVKTKKHKGRSESVKPPQVPLSFEAALDSGWKITEELGGWTFSTANRREGFLLLKRPRHPRTLYVGFVALYELRKPYFL